MTVCNDSKCEKGGNEVCCHECDHFGDCESGWKCDDPEYYEVCRTSGGVTFTDFFDCPSAPK